MLFNMRNSFVGNHFDCPPLNEKNKKIVIDLSYRALNLFEINLQWQYMYDLYIFAKSNFGIHRTRGCRPEIGA